MKYHSSKLFRVWIKTIRYLSSDSCVREETQYLRKVCEGKVEQGARGLEFGSSLTQETFSQLVKEWEALVNSVQEYQVCCFHFRHYCSIDWTVGVVESQRYWSGKQ